MQKYRNATRAKAQVGNPGDENEQQRKRRRVEQLSQDDNTAAATATEAVALAHQREFVDPARGGRDGGPTSERVGAPVRSLDGGKAGQGSIAETDRLPQKDQRKGGGGAAAVPATHVASGISKRPFDINHQRRRDIARLVVHRHGRLAKAALCIPYAVAAAWHCPSDSERRFLMVKWCRWVCAPPSVERQINAILEANPARYVWSDTLARHLHVSDAERTALRIWTIGAYDVPKAVRIKRRKEKDRLAAQVRRRANGSKSHEQSFSRTKPWEAAGFRCRRTWERHGKPVSQIRRHDSYLTPYDEFATSTARTAQDARGSSHSTNRARRTKMASDERHLSFNRALHHTRTS
jgi:hypothetical protein